MIVLYIRPIHFLCRIYAINVFFNIGIPVTITIFHRITRIIRIESVSHLPGIRHTITIRINHRSTFIFGQTTYLTGICNDPLFIRVNRKTSFYISTNEFRSVLHVNSFPCLHRLHHTGIHRIPFRESSPGIFQYIIIGSFGIHNSHMGH